MHCKHAREKIGAFSLLEIVAVVAVVAIMTAMLAPAISGFSSTAGRRGAVNMLMNGFEQARAAALENGSTIYVVMRRNAEFGGQDAFMVVRDDSMAPDATNALKYPPLTSWKKLPQGVLFYKAAGTLTDGVPQDALVDELRKDVPAAEMKSQLFVVGFNRHGQVISSAPNLWLYLAESLRSGAGAKETLRGASLTVTEKLSFRRYTGRPQLDFSLPPPQT